MIARSELAAWLRLLETPCVGRESARALLARFGSPEAAVGASESARTAIVGSEAGTALSRPPATFDARLDAAWRWLQSGSDVDSATGATRDAIAIGDPRFPQALLEAADPPLLLYVHGRVELLQRPSIAIVGSRNPTAQGLENARAFAAHLSGAGWVIVSGLALGIDGAAHEGALEGGAGTIGVVGTGLDIAYPLRHKALTARIAARGLVVSEFAIGTPALPPHFPIRNRVIAGLARGALVVEAALRSGSLITARMAVDAGREVFAIPGSIHSPQSRGCHALLKQGAKLVESAADIVDELGALDGTARPATASGGVDSDDKSEAAASRRTDPILEALGFDPMTLDELVARTGRSAAELSARLLDLELEGRVSRRPGQVFQRIERA